MVVVLVEGHPEWKTVAIAEKWVYRCRDGWREGAQQLQLPWDQRIMIMISTRGTEWWLGVKI